MIPAARDTKMILNRASTLVAKLQAPDANVRFAAQSVQIITALGNEVKTKHAFMSPLVDQAFALSDELYPEIMKLYATFDKREYRDCDAMIDEHKTFCETSSVIAMLLCWKTKVDADRRVNL